ncbi:hypothetical protein KL950_003273 [Ogataea haglerorum]|nr:hypothetical protein KL950_003273 [Ogataea haglerorum]
MEAGSGTQRHAGDANIPHPEQRGLPQVQQDMRKHQKNRTQARPSAAQRPVQNQARTAASRQAVRNGRSGDEEQDIGPGKQGHRQLVLQKADRSSDVPVQDGPDDLGRSQVCGAGPCASWARRDHRPGVSGHEKHGGLLAVDGQLQDQAQRAQVQEQDRRFRPELSCTLRRSFTAQTKLGSQQSGSIPQEPTQIGKFASSGGPDQALAEELLIGFDSYENDHVNVFLNTYTLEDDDESPKQRPDVFGRLEIMVKKYDGDRTLSNIVHQELIYNLSSADNLPQSDCGWFRSNSRSVDYVQMEPVQINNKVYDYRGGQLVNVRLLYFQLVHFGVETAFVGRKFLAVVKYLDDEIFLVSDMEPGCDESKGWTRFVQHNEYWIISLLSVLFLVLSLIAVYLLVLFKSMLAERARREGHDWAGDEKERLIREFFRR